MSDRSIRRIFAGRLENRPDSAHLTSDFATSGRLVSFSSYLCPTRMPIAKGYAMSVMALVFGLVFAVISAALLAFFTGTNLLLSIVGGFLIGGLVTAAIVLRALHCALMKDEGQKDEKSSEEPLHTAKKSGSILQTGRAPR